MTSARPEPIRIAFVITELDLGGAERALVQLVCGLPRDEWEPRVYCLGPPGELQVPLAAAEVPVHCFHATGLRQAPRVLRELTRALREFQPSIVQTFLFHGNLLGRLAAARAGVPVVVSGIRVAEHRKAWHRWLEWLTERWVTAHVCVSRGVADFCRDRVGLSPHKLHVIPNGIDVAPFRTASPIDRAREGLPEHARLLLTVARLDAQKGVDLLITAAANVLPNHPDAWVIIIGDGPLQAALRSQAEATGVKDRIRFLGTRRDVPAWMVSATALVLPSRWEGMPNVVLEAMAAGLPVLATDVEGVSELIQPGSNGWIVPKENPAALAEVMNRLLRQPEMTRGMGECSQHIIFERFTNTKILSSYTALYRRLLSADPPPHV